MTTDILMIDDQQDSFLLSTIRKIEERGYKCELKDFSSMEETIKNSTHNIVILDYFEGEKEPGLSWLDYIWDDNFRPVIIHSARAEEVQSLLIEKGFKNHPLINVTKKGSRSFQNLIDLLDYSETILKQIESYDETFYDKLKKIKQDTIKYSIRSLTKDILSSTPSKFDSIINRRLGNYLVKQNNGVLEAFEMYIYPPVSNSLLVGDILHNTKTDEYSVVLTPSCDLVESQGEVKKVHIAHIESIKTMLSDYSENTKLKSFCSGFPKKILNSGYNNGIVALPKLISAYDTNMCINLRNCEYINYKNITISKDNINRTKYYVRIASIDSPFSEMIIWAYMTIACRPGLPVRNVEDWSKSIYDEYFT